MIRTRRGRRPRGRERIGLLRLPGNQRKVPDFHRKNFLNHGNSSMITCKHLNGGTPDGDTSGLGSREIRMTNGTIRLKLCGGCEAGSRLHVPDVLDGGDSPCRPAETWWRHEGQPGRVLRPPSPPPDADLRVHLFARQESRRRRRSLPADEPVLGRSSTSTIPRAVLLPWAFGVARFEVSNFLRSRCRDRLYFSDELNLLLIEAHERLGLDRAEERMEARWRMHRPASRE